MVAQSLVPVLVRDACHVVRHGLMFCIAWGSLPEDGVQVRVEFQKNRMRFCADSSRRQMAVHAIEISGSFWIATTTGRFDRVTVTSLDSRRQCRIRTLRADCIA